MKNDKQTIYRSPEVEVLEINTQAIICQSPTGTVGDMERIEGNW